MDSLHGEIAALGTALCWSFGSTFFTVGGTRIGSVKVNRVRLAMAVLFLSITNFAVAGRFLPADAAPERWLWLGSSGIVGFVLGDAMLFEAFVIVGPRVSMLMMSLVPIMSALLGWIFLGEVLNAPEILAITMTVGGILWVVADTNRDDTWARGRRLAWGVMLALGGALGQTFGLVLSKKGLDGGFPALSGNLMRVLCATAVIWILALATGKAWPTIQSMRDRKALSAVIGGAAFGPYMGVWLSLVSIKYARLGIATTLMSLAPIFLIPISHWVFKERITVQAVLGTIVALTGVAILFMAVPG